MAQGEIGIMGRGRDKGKREEGHKREGQREREEGRAA